MAQNLYGRECPYLYRGIVESNEDPENLGRCKVRVPAIHGSLNYPLDLLQWARPLVFSPVGNGRGSVNLPDKGDIVWVLFEGSNKRFPVYFGGTYSKGDISVNKSTVDIYVEDDTKLSYSRNEKAFLLSVGSNNIRINSEGIDIIGDNSIHITSDGISILGDTSVTGDLTVSGDIYIGGSLTVAGNTTLNNLQINGSCNLQCTCER